MKRLQFGILLLFLLAVFSFPVLAAVTNTTVMTWVVPSNKSHTLLYGGTCSQSAFYFPEGKGEDSDVDGNTAKILPYPDSAGAGAACQTSGASGYGIRVTNNGNVTINIDANFQTDFASGDLNAGLKVWMGTGSGCGTSAFGGWQKFCTFFAPADTTSPVTQTACRDFNSTNATTTARLTSSLATNDTNDLCFSGEMTCRGNYSLSNCVTQGTYAHSFDTNAS